MNEHVMTFLVSCVPAIITGLVSWLVSWRQTKTQIRILKEQQRHQIEELKEKHRLEMEKISTENTNALEKMEKQYELRMKEIESKMSSEITAGLTQQLMGMIIEMPELKQLMAKKLIEGLK